MKHSIRKTITLTILMGIMSLNAMAQIAKPLVYTPIMVNGNVWDGIGNALDRVYSTAWAPLMNENLEDCDYFKLDRPIQVKGYYLASADYLPESPRSWLFYGSKDNGATWELLHEVKNDTSIYMNPLTDVYFPLRAATTDEYDHFKFVFTANHDYGEWTSWQVRVTEVKLEPTVCDAKGHKKELVMHQSCDPTCTEPGYTEICYECPACGQFYKDRNGLRLLGSSPIILPRGHNMRGDICSTCAMQDGRYALLHNSGVRIDIEDEGSPWTVGTASIGGEEVTVLRSANDSYYIPQPEDGMYDYSYEFPSHMKLHMSSEVPFTLSFRYRTLDDSYGDHTGYYMKINDWDVYSERETGQVHKQTFLAGTYDLPLSFTRIVYRPDDVDEDELKEEFDKMAMIIWDVKVEAECTHNGYEQILKESVAGNCITPAHEVYECTQCQQKYSVRTGDTYAFTHSSRLVAHAKGEPTCTEIGCTQTCYVCPDCMAAYEDMDGTKPLPSTIISNALGHDYGTDMLCRREGCGLIQDRRIKEIQYSGVTVFFDDQDLEYPFTTRPDDQLGEKEYRIKDRYGKERIFPKNALVSSNPEKTAGVTTFTVSSEQDFRLQFNYSMSLQSQYDNHSPIILSVIVDNEGVETYGYRYEEDWDYEKEDFYYIDLKAGSHKVTVSMNLYGPEAQGYWGDQEAEGDDFGYLWNIRACAHTDAWTNLVKEATCDQASETDFECHLCKFKKKIIGEKDPTNHVLEGIDARPATCTTMGVTSTYYYCDKCGLIMDESFAEEIPEKPLTAALGHDYDENGKCSRCDGNNFYDGIPETPVQVTSDVLDIYGLSSDYLDYYLIGNAKQLYGFAKLVNEQGMRDINAVLVDDIVVNRHILLSMDEVNEEEAHDVRNRYSETDHEYYESPYVDIKGKYSWTPMAQDEESPYKGIFDGRGHSISGLFYTTTDRILQCLVSDDGTNWYHEGYESSDDIGLFGVVKDGCVRELKLKDLYLHGTKRVGGIAGTTKHAMIEGCEVDGLIRGTDLNIDRKYSEKVGGIVGLAESGSSISQCLSRCSLDAWFDVGGVAGEMNESNIVACLMMGNPSSSYPKWYMDDDDQYFGLIVGRMSSNYGRQDYGITNTFTVQEITEKSPVTGMGNTKLTNVRQVGAEELMSGQIAHELSQHVRLSDPTGDWDWYTDESGHFGYHPLVYIDYNGDLWRQKLGEDMTPLLDNSKPHVYYGVTSCTDEAHIYSNAEILEAGHQYDSRGVCLKTDGEIHYEPCETDEHGTYLISNYGQLCYFAALVNNGQSNINARLTNDIVANEALFNARGELNARYANTDKTLADGTLLDWTPIATGTNAYRGHFDGARFAVRGLYCNIPNDYASLVGQLVGGTVSALTVDSCYLSSYGYAAPFAGLNKGTLANCAGRHNKMVTTTADDLPCVGGLVSFQDGVISHCLTDADCLYGKKMSAESGIDTSFCLSEQGGEDACSAEQMGSGMVCWLLNDGQSKVDSYWGQNLGNDDMPLLAENSKLVYYGFTDCANNQTMNYTNTESSSLQPGHLYREGICVHCGEYQQAAVAADGWYEVHNYGQLVWFANEANAKSTKDKPYNMKLAANIIVNKDLLTTSGKLNTTSPTRTWTPIGSPEHPFYGNINGQGHSISGLYCVTSSIAGLVGYMTSNFNETTGTAAADSISHLTIFDSYFETNGENNMNGYAGAFVGKAENGVVIYNCNAYGAVNGNKMSCIGGIAGKMSDNCVVLNCNNKAKVSGYNNVGGIVGMAENNSLVQYCANGETVTSTGVRLGGIVGYATQNTDITFSFNEKTITGNNTVSKSSVYAGGIVGTIENGIVNCCYNTAAVSIKTWYAGGIAGQMVGVNSDTQSGTVISNCYSSKTPKGLKYYSRIVASNDGGEVRNCYSAIDSIYTPATVKGETAVTLQQLGGGELCEMLNNPDGIKGTTADKARRRMAALLNDEEEDTSIVTEASIGDDISHDVVWRQRIGVDEHPTFSGPRVYYNKKTDEYICLEDGDVNADRLVNLNDVTAVQDVLLGKQKDDFGTADVNGNGKVSILDLILQIKKIKK